jgi:hypothetical protein
MNRAILFLNKPIQVAVILTTFLATAAAFAVDQPPQDPEQQRAWLIGHVITDMKALGTFDGNAIAKVPGIVNDLSDDQVALLAQYYFLTRSKTEQDASLYSLQQQGYADEQVNAAKAEIADLLTAMNDQIVACYQQFMPMPQPVQFVSYVVYASVPGWCCHARCFVPEWYYENNCFVGPCFDAAYAGNWGVPVCRAYYDHASRFYGRYHNVASTVYINHSVKLAKRRADWFRHQGDWKSVVAHDRLLHQSQTVRRTPPARLPNSNLGRYVPGSRNLAAHPGAKQRFNHKVAQQRKHKPQGNHAKAARPPKPQHKAAKAHAAHAAASHPVKLHQGAKPHANHASAPHPHAAHAGHAQGHAARPHPQHAAGTHSGHARHK